MSIINPTEYPVITVGIRDPKKVKVYPLSFADARKLKNLILSLIASISDLKKDGFQPMQIGTFIVSVIEENIGTITNMVLSEPIEEEELSLEQVSIITELVYTMNESSVKNLLGLWKKFKTENQPKAEKQ